MNGDYFLRRIKNGPGFKKWAAIGHFFSGILITSYAHDYPGSVAALMLVHHILNMQASMNSHLEFGLKELDIKDQAAFRDSTKLLNERV